MQLPSNILHQAFSEIDVKGLDNEIEIFFSTMVGLSGHNAEGWVTGIAIDASISMIDTFGKGLTGSVPENIKKNYLDKGWIQTRNHDGERVHYWKDNAFNDAINQGYLKPTQNLVEIEARKFSVYLAHNLDEAGCTDIVYWACGKSGKEIEEVGKIDAKDCDTIILVGPKDHDFGQATHLLPALEHFEKKSRLAKRGFFIFITDGELDDLNEIKSYTIQLAKKIKANQRNSFKAIIIGLGEKINENQMSELDDLDTGTDVDIWDHKIANQMKDILEIFAELVDENMLIAPLGLIRDDQGNIVKKYNDGVPAKGHFVLPKSSEFFIFEIGNQIIKQQIKIT